MRIRTLLVIAPAVALALGLVTGCSKDDTKPSEFDTTTLPAATSPAPAQPAVTSAPPKAAEEQYPGITAKDFKVIGYVQIGSTNQWKPDELSSGLAVLTAGTNSVTAFTLDGITCEVTLDGIQATPARVVLMATTAQMGGLKPGKATYYAGSVKVGDYDCRKA